MFVSRSTASRRLPAAIGWLGVAALLCGPLPLPRSAGAAVPEYEVKAALLYKIGKFVHWPEHALSAAGVIKVCVVGHDDFGASIDALQGQKLQGQVITIDRLTAAQLAGSDCQIAFISRSEKAGLATLLNTVGHLPILTVSDADHFATLGGIVGLEIIDSKVQFQINPAASKRAGLEIGAQLLQLATLVADDTQPVKP